MKQEIQTLDSLTTEIDETNMKIEEDAKALEEALEELEQ